MIVNLQNKAVKKQRGFTLISILAAIVIIVILSAIYFGGGGYESGREDGQGKSPLGSAVLKSKDYKCREYIQQVRASIQIMVDIDDYFPQSLDEVNVPASMKKCPIGGEPYILAAPENNFVYCPHLGHEKF